MNKHDFGLFCSLLLLQACSTVQPEYSRDSYAFASYTSGASIGYYSGQYCEDIDIDHVVSLADAHESGAALWSDAEKALFANDHSNHVEACASINRSKGSSTPSDFLRKSHDGAGVEFSFVDFCGYVARYVSVKEAYELSFKSNNGALLESCS
tara:strand:+ start:3081 stop:3539 length:459 start_codon:yes stop_codon:yes gene_type:complete